eukprot:TRINITY_DN1234_c0_g1_i1.p1 TRINITY_DN1234_c0_g1~~TRINITY_DN1234_c0_g1_i1.p1  ORF type:complete len:573 (+),score=74.65 TRINITY_DN1234_c0_g1_i1:104-1822(+)
MGLKEKAVETAAKIKSDWTDKRVQKAFILELERKLNIERPEDWYKFRRQDVDHNGGMSLMRRHYKSLIDFLRTLRPDYSWDPLKFEHKPSRFWYSETNRRRLFDEIGKKIGIKQLEDWYNVTTQDITRHGGDSVLWDHYKGSFKDALAALYPEYPWNPMRWRANRRRFDNPNVRRTFIEQAAKAFNIQKPEEWYGVQRQEFMKLPFAPSFLECYGDYLINALRDLYPEVHWDETKFARVPKNYWKDPKAQRGFFDRLAKKLRMNEFTDWYGVTREEVISEAGGETVLSYHHNSLARAIAAVFPEHQFRFADFQKNSISKSQRILRREVEELLLGPNLSDSSKEIIIHSNYLHPDIKISLKNRLELDIYVPELNLAFEFQGLQHYEPNVYLDGTSNVNTDKKEDHRGERGNHAHLSASLVGFSERVSCRQHSESSARFGRRAAHLVAPRNPCDPGHEARRNDSSDKALEGTKEGSVAFNEANVAIGCSVKTLNADAVSQRAFHGVSSPQRATPAAPSSFASQRPQTSRRAFTNLHLVLIGAAAVYSHWSSRSSYSDPRISDYFRYARRSYFRY